MVDSTTMIARRGRSRSDSESNKADPKSRTRGPPNMLNAVRTGDPVASYMIVPRARLATDPATTMRHWEPKRVRNWATANSSR